VSSPVAVAVAETVADQSGGVDGWLHGELDRLGATQPAFVRVLRWTWRHPVLVLVAVNAVLVGTLGAFTPAGDAAWFREAGSGMLGRHFFDVFEVSGLQIGPLYLVALGVLDRAVLWLHLPELFVLAALQSSAIAWFAMWTARRAALAARMPVRPAQWAIGAALVLTGHLALGVASGHPEEILVALVLANGALFAASGRHVVGGVLVGVATGVKQWGLFGGGLVLLGRRPLRASMGAVVALATTAAFYVPFAIWGHIATFEHDWGIPRDSLLAHLGGWVGTSDWDLRVVQGGLAGLTGAALASQRRCSALVPVLGAIAMRLFLDPLRLTYYAGAFVAVLVIWLWSTDQALVRRWRLAVTCLIPVAAAMPYLLHRGDASYVLHRNTLWWLGTVALVGGTAAAVWLDRRATRPLGA
jgi:hypothetical protein